MSDTNLPANVEDDIPSPAYFAELSPQEVAQDLYFKHDFCVFPLSPRDKTPPKGFSWKEWQIERPDEDTIDAWAEQYPDANYALVCGAVSDLCVVDVDDLDAIDWCRAHLPHTRWMVRTTKGWHLYYRLPPLDSPWRRILDSGTFTQKTLRSAYNVAIDVQLAAHYVVAPGSVHPSGRRYVAHFEGPWEDVPTFELIGLPGWPGYEQPAVTVLPAGSSDMSGDLSAIDLSGVSAGVYTAVPKGSRNTTMTQYVGGLVAQGIKPSDAFRMALQKNREICVPPLPDGEVRTIVDSCFSMHARNHPEAIPGATPISIGASPTPTGAASTESLAQTMDGVRIISAEDLQEEPVPEAILHPGGILGEIQAYTMRSHICTSPVFATAGAFAILGTLIGQRFRTHTELATNEYFVVIGPSSSGKDAPKKAAVKLLKEVAPSHLGPTTITSDAAVVTYATTPGNFRCLFVFDEVGMFLQECKNTNSPKSGFIRLFTILFSSANEGIDKGFANIKDNKVSPWHCVSMLGMSVPSEFYGGLTSNAAINGFLARILVFEIDELPDETRAFVDSSIPSDLAHKLKAFVNMPIPGENTPYVNAAGEDALDPQVHPYTVLPTDDAQQLHATKADIYKHLSRSLEKDGRVAESSVYARVAEHALKLALIFAASREGASLRDNPVATLEDFSKAWATVEWCADRLARKIQQNIAESEFAALCQTIRKAIVKAVRRAASKGGTNKPRPGATLAEITKATRGTPQDFVKKALEKLVQANELRYLAGWKSSAQSKRAMNLFCLVVEEDDDG